MLNVINLHLSFGSINNLPSEELSTINKFFSKNKTTFDYTQLDENVIID